MAYGLRVWDQLGQLGTDSSDVLGLCLFADYIPYSSFPFQSVTIQDVDDRPRLVWWRFDFNGRWFVVSSGDITYDSGARTLTVANSNSAQPGGTFFLVIQW